MFVCLWVGVCLFFFWGGGGGELCGFFCCCCCCCCVFCFWGLRVCCCCCCFVFVNFVLYNAAVPLPTPPPLPPVYTFNRLLPNEMSLGLSNCLLPPPPSPPPAPHLVHPPAHSPVLDAIKCLSSTSSSLVLRQYPGGQMAPGRPKGNSGKLSASGGLQT